MAVFTLAFSLPTVARENCINSYWIPFDAELYAPESELTIEARAFEKGSIPKSVAISLAPENFPTTEVQAYNPKNVRAVVLTSGAEIYIDRFGWVRQGSAYGKADMAEIEEKLSRSCEEK